MIGTILRGRFELTGLVQDGPVFSSYSARDRNTSREVCLRVLNPPFSAETAFVAKLAQTVDRYSVVRSPHVETLQSVDPDEGTPFIVGELTRAPLLAERVKKLAPFSIPLSVATAVSMCKGLDALHRGGLVHGDVSPSNCVVLADGEIKLQIAGIWEAYSNSPTAGAVVLPGMAPYLAPEVSSGAMPHPGSDAYAVGIILYELLTGRHPYIADTPLATAMKHTTAPTPSVRDVNPSVPMVLDEIVKKAMAKDPTERYSNAGELLQDLRLLQDALRFGRSLTWPLRQPAPVTEEPVKKGVKTSPSPRVAPRMSAIRDEDPDQPKARPKPDRDVPVWMMMIAMLLFGAALVCLAFWFFGGLTKTPLVAVPNVRNLSTTEARSLLEKMHLEMKIDRREPNDRLESDRVIETTPSAGTKVHEKSQISVVVSSGSRYVEVPEIRGLTPDKARSVLSGLNLRLSRSFGKASDPSVPEGTIVEQDPAPQKKVERDRLVTVKINTAGAEPVKSAAGTTSEPNGQPDQAEAYLYTLNVKVTNTPAGVQLKVEIVDAEGTRVIHDEMHQPDEDVNISAKSASKSAKFRIYYDDKLVKELEKSVESEKRR